MTPVLLTAMGVEAAAVRLGLRRARRSATVRVCGAGSRAGRPEIPDAAAVVVTGVCGSVDPGLRPGTFVVADRVLGPDGRERFLASAPLLAAALRAAGLPVSVGTLATVDRVVHDDAERKRLQEQGILAVDTETATLLPARDEAVAVVRVVVDAPGAGLLTPAIVTRGSRALARLAAGVPSLLAWADACIPRTVLLAEPRSFCAGVERAIATVERALDQTDGPVFVRRQVVHNAHVVSDLAGRGAVFVEELDEVPPGSTVVLSAHGVAPEVREQARDRALQVIDATCPLVAKVHAEARHAAERGDTIVLVGHAEHEEVVGTVGEAPSRTVVLDTPEAAATLEVADPDRVTWLSQTTLAVDETESVLGVLRERFPAGRGPGGTDICYATANRQTAVRAVAADSDVLLVLGSTNSSNSRRLVEVSERAGTPSVLIEDVTALDPALLTGRARVGISAGASAPPALVDAVVAALRGLGPVDVTTAGPGPETLAFDLPKEVRA